MKTEFESNKVSIIIPTYNRAKFLANALESIKRQNYNNIEIIIIDDGSIDDTKTEVDNLKNRYSTINIIYCQNERPKGPAGARNSGILKATGEYLAFLDSDDIWLDNHLVNGIESMNKHSSIDVLFGNFKKVDYYSGDCQGDFFKEKKFLFTLKSKELLSDIFLIKDNLFKALIRENFFHFSSAIIRKKSTNGLLLNEKIKFAEDCDFAIRLFKEAKANFAYRKKPVFILYIHDANMTQYDNLDVLLQINTAEILLFSEYMDKYILASSEIAILRTLISQKFLDLSYVYRKKSQISKSILCSIRAIRYEPSLMILRELIKSTLAAFPFSRVLFSFFKRVMHSKQ